MNNQDKLYQQYKDFDPFQAKAVEPKAMKKIQELRSKELEKSFYQTVFDDEVINWIINQDSATKNHINGMVKDFMAQKNQLLT
ncbi:MAG: hypothetical protein KGV51_00255 [Moraxellaceae bacterium]|nr:hypothetical protein [Moraxellaceae bacterium]